MAKKLSPLVRGEWIEISVLKYSNAKLAVSPRERGVD